MDIFDLHCDTIGECAKNNIELNDNLLAVSLKKAASFGCWCQFFAVWIPDDKRSEKAYSYFKHVYRCFSEQLAANRGNMHFCTNTADISSNRCNAFFSVEGGAVLGGKLSRLNELYNMGVRMLTLTWNGHCELGDGSGTAEAAGLTDFGKQVVIEAQKLGIIVDVSHLSDAGFADVAEIACKPFIASHSNSRSICNHRRNLTNEQFKLICSRGGLVGLNLYPVFLGGNSEKCGCEMLYRHLMHFLELGGENTVALGTDFDGADMPDDLRSIDRLFSVEEYLLARGLKESTVRKFLFKNAYSFFREAI